MSSNYDSWLRAVCRSLVHRDAIGLTAGDSDKVLRTWHKFGAHPRRVAGVLNERWINKRWRDKQAEAVQP